MYELKTRRIWLKPEAGKLHTIKLRFEIDYIYKEKKMGRGISFAMRDILPVDPCQILLIVNPSLAIFSLMVLFHYYDLARLMFSERERE